MALLSVQKAHGGVEETDAVVIEGLLSGRAMHWQQRGVSSLGFPAWTSRVLLLLAAPGEEKPPCRAVLRI